MARDRVEPIGPRRLDMLFALLCSVVAEPNRDRDKRSKPFALSDFLIDWWAERGDGEQDGEQTVEEQLAIVEMLNTAFGGRDLRKREETNGDAG